MSVLYKTNIEEAISNKPNAATAFNLGAAATQANGLRNVLAAYADTDKVPCHISDNAGLWEEGIYTVAGTTLVRTSIDDSSNGGSAVDFSSGGALTLIVSAQANLNELSSNRHLIGFSVNSLTAAITLTSGVFSKVVNWLNSDYNYNSDFNLTSGEYTVPKTGFYLLGVGLYITGLSTDSTVITRVYVNGVSSGIDINRITGIRGNNSSNPVVKIKLNAGDVVSVYGYFAGTAGTINDSVNTRFFMEFCR